MTPLPAEFSYAIVIAALGVAVNLIFNVVNFRRTSALKHRDVRLDEFKRLRTGVTNVLAEMRADQQSLRVLSNSVSAKAKWQAELSTVNMAMGETYEKLSIALGEFDESPYASGTTWAKSTEGDWDACLQTINGGYNPTRTLDQRKAAAAETATRLGSLVKTVNDQLVAELARHAPPERKRGSR